MFMPSLLYMPQSWTQCGLLQHTNRPGPAWCADKVMPLANPEQLQNIARSHVRALSTSQCGRMKLELEAVLLRRV